MVSYQWAVLCCIWIAHAGCTLTLAVFEITVPELPLITRFFIGYRAVGGRFSD